MVRKSDTLSYLEVFKLIAMEITFGDKMWNNNKLPFVSLPTWNIIVEVSKKKKKRIGFGLSTYAWRANRVTEIGH